MEKVLTVSKVEAATDVIFMGSSQVKTHLRRDAHKNGLNTVKWKSLKNMIFASEKRIFTTDLWSFTDICINSFRYGARADFHIIEFFI